MKDDDADLRECAGCICAGVRRASRALSQHYARHMRETGLVGTQFSTLVVLGRNGPMPMGRLAKHLGVERTTLTRNLKPIEKKQWVTVSGDEDGRKHLVAITAKGKAVLRAAIPAWRAAQASVGPKLKELRLAELLARAG